MMCASNPTIEISKAEDGKWTISTVTAFRTATYTFKLGEEYEETMPGNTLKVCFTAGKLVIIYNEGVSKIF